MYIAGAAPRRRYRPGVAVLPGSKNTCKQRSGFPRNLGDPVVSTDYPGWRYRVTNSRSASFASGRAGIETTRCNRGTAKRRQRSAAGRAAGSRSALIVLSKPGNAIRTDPVEGSEASDQGLVGGKHFECFEIRKMCSRNSDE